MVSPQAPGPAGPPPVPPPSPPGRPASRARGALVAVSIVLGTFAVLGGAIALAIWLFGEGSTRAAAPSPGRVPRPGFVPAPLPADVDGEVQAALRAGTCRRNDVERGRPAYLTATRGRGAASSLRGKVALVHFKVSLPAAPWPAAGARAVTVSARASRAYLLEQARRHGVTDLAIDAIEWPLQTDLAVPSVRLDARKRVREDDSEAFRRTTRAALERALGTTLDDLVEELSAMGYRSAGFLVHFPAGPRGVRDFAAPTGAKGDRAELAYALEPDWGHASRSLLAAHELLHLFGADDLYDLRGTTPDEANDVMNAECTGLGPTFVGPATAFGVGWLDAPPPRGYSFP